MRGGVRRLSLIVAAATAAMLAATPLAQAGPTSPTTAIVSMGDSFISGEAGRWDGNSLSPFHNRYGTDRAAYNCDWWSCDYDAHRVYGASFDNDCDRSDVAPIRSTTIAVNERINIACSGARTKHIWRASAGGQSFKGEAPQANQLATIAAQKNVKLIVLTITANDLGFTDHVIDCTVAWSTSSADDPDYCHPEEQAEMNAAQPAALAGLRKAIDEIRAVMTAAGYTSSQYKLQMMGYASPVPVGADIRYPESGWSRLDTGGCPFWNADADWAKNQAAPFMNNGMRSVGIQKGVPFIDVNHALDGHEVCHRSSSLVSGSKPKSESGSEWVRWLNSGCCQGEAQESLHPNAYGQRMLGRCLTLMYAKTSGNWDCRRTGRTISTAYLQAIP